MRCAFWVSCSSYKFIELNFKDIPAHLLMNNLYVQLQEQARRQPDAVALWQCKPGGEAFATTYAMLSARSQHYATAFHCHAPDACIVPLLLGKSAECVAAMFGVIGAGKAFSCLNRKLRGPQQKSILHVIGPTLGICDGLGLMSLSADSMVAESRWWIIRDGSFLNAHERAAEQLQKMVRVEYGPPDNLGEVTELPMLENDPSRIGCCLFTSGSTGEPKGVLISESDLRARADAEMSWFDIRQSDVLLSILPFSFDVGLNQLLAAVCAGCSLVLTDSWLPADILRAVQQFKVTGISAVPAIWSDMLGANLSFDTERGHASLRYITISGGDMTEVQLAQMPKMAPGVDIFKTYGQTEAFRTTSLRPQEFAARPRSVGRAFASARIYIVREDNSLCNANEEGEIVHTGLGVMLGYLDKRDPQNKMRENPFYGPKDSSRLAIYTGDLGYVDESGYLYINGRRDAMLKVSGNRVYPKEILRQLLTIQNVRDGEVIGIKAEDGQTQLLAFAVVSKGAWKDMDIRRELANRLPTYMVPRQVILLTELPRTASGKPDRPALMRLGCETLSIKQCI